MISIYTIYMKSSISKNSRAGFTLFELIVALGIIAGLSTAAVLTINPNQTFKQTRDANRVSDMQTLNNALLHYQVAGGSNLGSTNTIYISLPSNQSNCSDLLLPTPPIGWSYACKPAASYRNTDGTGWIPVNFTIAQSSIGAVFSTLPIDPLNTLVGDFYYTYIHDTDWAVSATMESTKGLANTAAYDGGSSVTRFEVGKDIYLNSNLGIGGGVSSAKAVTAFSFASPVASGVITEGAHTITVAVPSGTNVTALVPTITISGGASISPLSGVAQNFTSPVAYTVTAQDNSTQIYTVTVTVTQAIGDITNYNYGGAVGDSQGIAFDGTNMWIAIYNTSEVAKILPDGTITTRATVGTNPQAIAFDGAGNMWTANYTANSVSKITALGGVTSYSGPGILSGPVGIARDGLGNMWVANYGNSTISKVDSGGFITSYNLGGYQPQAIAFDGTNMWLSINSLNTVVKVSPTGTVTTFGGTTGSGPRGIAFDGTNMWTANFTSNSVTKVTPSGVMTTYGPTGANPRDIAFDGTHMWTVNWNGDSVTRIALDGTIVGTYASTGWRPNKIAFDGTNVWTANTGNGVSKIVAK